MPWSLCSHTRRFWLPWSTFRIPTMVSSLFVLALLLHTQVLAAVADDFENPYNSIIRSGKHEQKLKDWKKMTPQEK